MNFLCFLSNFSFQSHGHLQQPGQPIAESVVSAEQHGGQMGAVHACNAAGQFDQVVSLHPVYQVLGDTAEKRQFAYRELFRQHLDAVEVHAIRQAVNQELILGRDDFKEEISTMIQRRVYPGVPGRPRVEDEQGYYYVL